MLNFYVKKKINSAIQHNNRKHAFLNMETMQRILIFFTYKDWEQVAQIGKELSDKGKDVMLWTVQPKKERVILTSINTTQLKLRIINPKEVSWKKSLAQSVMDEFAALKYDTLIDLTTEDDKALLYLLANNTSQFCIGIKDLDYKAFDFTVLKENDKDLLETYEQIKFYLKNIG